MKPSIQVSPAGVARRETLLWCLLLFALGLLLRVAYLHVLGIASPENDAKEYAALARHLAEGRGFTSDGLTPSTYRPPLFSWLLGGWCYLLRSSSLPTMVAFQALVQTLCSPLTCLLLLQIGQDRRTALTGGLFVAAYPFIVSTVGQLLQEPTQMLVAVGIDVATVAWCREPSTPRAAVCGLLFGLGALAKSPFLAVQPVTLLVWCFGRDFRRQLPFRQIALACAVATAVVLPWTIRNYRVSGGQFIPINSQNQTYPVWLVADDNFYPRYSLSEPLENTFTPQKGVALTYGNKSGVDFLIRANEELLRMGESGIGIRKGLAIAARSYLVRHPLYLLRITARGAVLLFSPDASAGLSRFLVARIVAMILFHLPLAAGLVIGIVRAGREKNAAFMVLALFAVAYLLVHAPGTGGGGRYSVPVIPILMAVGSYGLWGNRSASSFCMTTSSRVPNSSGQPSSTLSSRFIQGSHLSG